MLKGMAMRSSVTLKTKITLWIAFVMLAIGSLVCAALIAYEYSKSLRRFESDVRDATSLLAELVVRDVTVGNYFSVRTKLRDYAKYKGVNTLILCLQNNESIAVVNREGVDPIRCNSPEDAGEREIIARAPLMHEGISFGMLIVNYPREIVAGQMRNLVRAIIVSFVVVLAIAIVMLHYATRYALRPIVSYIAWMKGIADSGEISRGALKNNGVRSREEGDLRQAFAIVLDKYTRVQEQRREESLMASVGRISSQLAHDIRSPLSVLKNFVEATQNAALSKHDIEEIRNAAYRSLKKLQNMAEDLLDYSKAQKAQTITVSIDEIASDVLREVSREAAAHDVMVWHEGAAGIVADLDRGKFNRVLTNMMLNGIQAHENAGSVSLKTELDGSNLLISIIDDGQGIPSENRDKIFDSSFTFGKPRGTGLGLAYCRQVVEAHGGKIDVRSELGKGSIFTIRIPDCVVEKGEGVKEDKRQYACSTKIEVSATK